MFEQIEAIVSMIDTDFRSKAQIPSLIGLFFILVKLYFGMRKKQKC